MFLEIYMEIYSAVFALSQQINKYAKTINLLCTGNKFCKIWSSRGVL